MHYNMAGYNLCCSCIFFKSDLVICVGKPSYAEVVRGTRGTMVSQPKKVGFLPVTNLVEKHNFTVLPLGQYRAVALIAQ
jgi:hypothetical protein